jgi:hypothetical protein
MIKVSLFPRRFLRTTDLKFFMFLIFALIINSCQPEWRRMGQKYDYTGMDSRSIDLHKNAEAFLYDLQKYSDPVFVPSQAKIQSLRMDYQNRYFEIEFTKPFSYIPFRAENSKMIYDKFREFLDKKFQSYEYHLMCLGTPIEELIPNYYRTDPLIIDKKRLPAIDLDRSPPIVQKMDFPEFKNGLTGKHIAVWPSHGWYYNYIVNRWEWQRPRLFQTVEDLLSFSLVNQYLIPMLENAGAYVFTPRERDIQIYEVIVDNDSDIPEKGNYLEISTGNNYNWRNGTGAGFGLLDSVLQNDENPFIS